MILVLPQLRMATFPLSGSTMTCCQNTQCGFSAVNMGKDRSLDCSLEPQGLLSCQRMPQIASWF